MIPKRILVIRVGNLGDVLMVTPVIRKLKAVFPDSCLDFVTSGQARVVAEANKYIDNIFIYRKYKRLPGAIRKFIFERQLARNKYDLCVVLEQHPQYHRFARNILGTKGLKIGFSSVPPTPYLDHSSAYQHHDVHAIDNGLFLLRDYLNIPLDPDDCLMDFVIPDHIEQGLKGLLPGWKGDVGKYIVIHPSCSGYQFLRTWVLANYNPVIHFLKAQGYRVFLTGASSDKTFVDQIIKDGGFVKADVEAFVDRSLYEVSFLIKHAAGVISPDTGIMHIARAFNVPTIALFGPSNPLHTGCIGSGAYVQIRNDFKCGPCNYYPEYRLEYKQACIDEGKPPACMRSISVEQVTDALKKILAHE